MSFKTNLSAVFFLWEMYKMYKICIRVQGLSFETINNVNTKLKKSVVLASLKYISKELQRH